MNFQLRMAENSEFSAAKQWRADADPADSIPKRIMNKGFYKLVYSRVRHMLVAVADFASAHRTAPGARRPATRSHHAGPVPALRALVLAAMVLIGNVILSAPSIAQIVAVPGSGAQVIQTQNGLPQVNISRPSSAGVSVNNYSQFDVQRQGAILNNAATITQTQQAGYVNGNPNLTPGREARIIVNQVQSNAPSQLRGYLEVAGSRAEVVVANPQGILVDGAGFINTSRAVLTTGTPNFGPSGNLTGFNVTGGTITLSGTGVSIDNTAANAGIPSLGLAPGQALSGVTIGGLSGNAGGTKAGAASVNGGSGLVNPIIASATALNVLSNLTIPQGGLFRPSGTPGANYLIETNPAFTNQKSFISSDYFLQQLGFDPQVTEKRLGDGFYEQQLVRNQITSLTGRAVLGPYTDLESMYESLLTAGASLVKSLDLPLGMALSPEQVAALTSNVIILQTQVVNGQSVLVPVVYLAAGSQQKMQGPLIAASDVDLKNAQTFTNSGTVQAGNTLSIDGKAIDNAFGTLQSGGLMLLTTKGNVDLTSSTVNAGSLALKAGGDLILNTAVNTVDQVSATGATRTTTTLGPIANLNVAGNALIVTGGNVEQNAGNLNVGGGLDMTVGGDWNLGAAQTGEHKVVERANGVSNTNINQMTGSSVVVGGVSEIGVGGDLTATGANIDLGVGGGDTNIKGATVDGGQVSALIGGNLNIESVQDTSHSAAHQASQSAGVSISQAGGSASYSQQKGDAHGDYAGVEEQSGIHAGAGGFDINVKGNTDLKGAYISSDAEDAKNTLTTGTLSFSDIANASNYDAKSSGFSAGGSMGAPNSAKANGVTAVSDGGGVSPMISQNDSGNEHATTKSGISAGTISGTNNVAVIAGRDVNLNGAMIQAGGNAGIKAGRDINVGTTEFTSTREVHTHTVRTAVTMK